MKPKKSLGQNFLTSQKAVFEIINAGNLNKEDIVLEIGPGKGALTEDLLKKTRKVIAVEKDKNLVKFLENKFEKEIEEKKLILLEEDILNFKIDNFLKKGENYKIIANIPYYITGTIIEKFLSSEIKPLLMVLLIQKEVAERIIARNKKESILSLAVKFYGNPKLVYKVSAGSFFPKPKVDSAVLKIDIHNKKNDKILENNYFNILKQAFAFKRKYLLNNLKKGFPAIDWEGIFNSLGLNLKIRAEDLSLQEFLNLASQIKTK